MSLAISACFLAGSLMYLGSAASLPTSYFSPRTRLEAIGPSCLLEVGRFLLKGIEFSTWDFAKIYMRLLFWLPGFSLL